MVVLNLQVLGESAAVIVGSGLFLEGLSRLLRSLARRAGARPVTVNGLRDGLRIIWLLVSAVAVISFTQVASEFTVLTISGVAGLVLSLSLQSVFSNIIAGLFLLRDGAVRVGDVIEFGGIRGRVARVALRNTWIVTESGTVAIIGNSVLLGGPLLNHTAAPRFRADLGT